MNSHELYRSTKDIAREYFLNLSADELQRTCKACPAWTVQDVIAHHIHAQRCVVEGTFESRALDAIAGDGESARRDASKARDEWTQAGVLERRERSAEDLLAEWDIVAEGLNGNLMALTVDLTVHFDDIRETLEGRVPRTGLDVPFSSRRFHELQSMRLQNNGLSSISLRVHEGHSYDHPDAETVVTGPEYELLRCMVSRRQRSEADEILDWGGTPDSTRALFAIYDWPEK